MQKIVILTGAGISAESGLGTFRDEDGLWAKHPIEDVATPEGFSRDPSLVHAFYNARRKQAADAQPNTAHKALTKLEIEYPGEVVIITQNVDTLHEVAGSKKVLHMHGTLAGGLCTDCNHRWTAPMEMTTATTCPSCGNCSVRPDVVWFGERPYFMDAIASHLQSSGLFVSIGTSGQVYPAAAFVQEATAFGAETVELNLEPSEISRDFNKRLFGPATKVVPDWVDGVLSGNYR